MLTLRAYASLPLLSLLACTPGEATSTDTDGSSSSGAQTTTTATATGPSSESDTDPTSTDASTTASATTTDATTDATTDTTADTTTATTTDTVATDSDTDIDSDTDTDTDSDTDSDSDSTTGGVACTVVEPPVAAVDCALAGISLTPEFAPFYTCYDLGNLNGVPNNWGGLTIKQDDPYTLLIGGAANTTQGKLYAVEITRDADCHITGWSGAPISAYAEAEYNDGGVTYGPDGVLFLARWPVNQLGQQKPGSLVTDKIIDLGPLGVVPSPGGLGVVPKGFGGEGQLKAVSWAGGQWYTLSLNPDGNGTFNVTSAVLKTTIVGGPEGFVHIGADNPGFPVNGMLVSEYSANKIAAYHVDGDGDPLNATRRDFITGLTGAEGAFLDPASGDFLFTTFGGGNRLIAVRGFLPNPQ